ncbi:putative DUF21 domain-containing protein, chloroplastic, partial [Tanacetum coccineum]
MNSTLLKTTPPPFINHHPLPKTRFSDQFQYKKHFQTIFPIKISRKPYFFNIKAFKENPLHISTQNEEPIKVFSKRYDIDKIKGMIRFGVVMGVLVLGVIRCQNVMAMEGGSGLGGMVNVKGFWNGPKFSQVLRVFREQGLIFAGLLGLSAFFSMAETSITTLSPWKLKTAKPQPNCLAPFFKFKSEGLGHWLWSWNATFPLYQILNSSDVANAYWVSSYTESVELFVDIIASSANSQVTCYSVVNIGATALLTEAATMVFGKASISAATGVMTVRLVAWISIVLYPVGRVVTFLSMGMLKILGLKAKSEPSVTEDELKLMLRVVELSGPLRKKNRRTCCFVQDMIENVLEIKDTHVKEVMTPLVDVVAVDASVTILDFHHLWVTHQYSRVPVFEQRIDNIVGIAYAMDLLDLVKKGDMVETAVVGEIAHKPAYFVPDSMLVWNLLREFRIRKVHMAVVLNEYGGTVGIVTLEDVVEEIVGEIFDENDSKEEIERKTGNIVKRADGVFDVD